MDPKKKKKKANKILALDDTMTSRKVVKRREPTCTK